MHGFVMLTLYRETPLAPYVALTSVTAQLLVDTMYPCLAHACVDREPMLALTVAACGIVLVGAGVLWLKPWIDDYGEISD
jgi:hypothetical protein